MDAKVKCYEKYVMKLISKGDKGKYSQIVIKNIKDFTMSLKRNYCYKSIVLRG